jgi:hypothetical protein
VTAHSIRFADYDWLGQEVDLNSQFHHVFFFGDLNYRIDMDREKVVEICSTMSEAKVTAQTRPESALFELTGGAWLIDTVPHGMLRVAHVCC